MVHTAFPTVPCSHPRHMRILRVTDRTYRPTETDTTTSTRKGWLLNTHRAISWQQKWPIITRQTEEDQQETTDRQTDEARP